MAQSTTFRELTTLDLRDNSVGDEGPLAIVQSTVLSQLGSLVLGNNGLTDKGRFSIAFSSLSASHYQRGDYLKGIRSGFLKRKAKELGVEGVERMKKEELVSILLKLVAVGQKEQKSFVYHESA